jgi:hypothetical protein
VASHFLCLTTWHCYMKVKQVISYFVYFLALTLLFVTIELFLTLYGLFGIGSVAIGD